MRDGEARFAGHVAVVTGGGNGIGAACCRRFATDGARVAVLDRDAAGGRKVEADCGPGALFIQTEMADPESIQAAFDAIAGQLGPITVLVNNVSVALSSPLADSDDEHWLTVLHTNFLGAVRSTRLAVRVMREHGGGAVVSIASVHSRRGYPDWAAYASAKGALMSFTLQQAVEQADYGIRLNVVTPGATMTDLNRRRIQAAMDPAALEHEMASCSPLKRYASPEEIANVVTFAASAEASFMTGSDLVVDGGAAILGT